jgi:hypothetical protein
VNRCFKVTEIYQVEPSIITTISDPFVVTSERKFRQVTVPLNLVLTDGFVKEQRKPQNISTGPK